MCQRSQNDSKVSEIIYDNKLDLHHTRSCLQECYAFSWSGCHVTDIVVLWLSFLVVNSVDLLW